MRHTPGGRVARLRDQIDFGKPGRGHVPTVGLHRNVVLQQRARLGPPVQAPLMLLIVPLQTPVHLPGADPQQLLLDLRAQPIVLENPGQPTGQQGLQTHRPGIARGFPHPSQDGKRLLAVAWLASSRRSHLRPVRRRTVEQANRVLAMVSARQTEFVQHPLPAFAVGFAITLVDHPKVLPPRLVSHPNSPKNSVFESGYILSVSTASLPVTFCMARYALLQSFQNRNIYGRQRSLSPGRCVCQSKAASVSSPLVSSACWPAWLGRKAAHRALKLRGYAAWRNSSA